MALGDEDVDAFDKFFLSQFKMRIDNGDAIAIKIMTKTNDQFLFRLKFCLD